MKKKQKYLANNKYIILRTAHIRTLQTGVTTKIVTRFDLAAETQRSSQLLSEITFW